VTISVTATDNCETPNCRIISITSEPDTNPRTRPARVDWDLTGGLSLNLRAKRAGTRTDRTYTITIQCTDLAGNASTRTVAVTVPHDRRGVSTVSR
jgi:hypothetical protein